METVELILRGNPAAIEALRAHYAKKFPALDHAEDIELEGSDINLKVGGAVRVRFAVEVVGAG